MIQILCINGLLNTVEEKQNKNFILWKKEVLIGRMFSTGYKL